ncbi:PhzF family phenazine biosynthesis protein [Burkholderia cenocepacia]|uniref:PhzF family phenazine biosynthesis protein n=1 Tax=Burkholderia cenocepacia TaxID=95486 RepID=UPI0026536970|nr:PhzF family phenazine biosynthesis protein [Burkholderia cenocepacia]MDI9647913.1 PhzF family phenazine biosynthesis protein [Burkholderia cenocepacia]MDN7455551.1 PhzF family phenazine biosynthesis protein [Burkholderia cenocepacia]
MSSIPFKQVDVFTGVRYRGNPVAVVVNAHGLTSEQMQQIANWTNLSETTFVLPATDSRADYRLRIFTPNSELPFAGHPTIGTAHALLEAGLVQATGGTLIQECGAGLVQLRIAFEKTGQQWISFELPSPAFTPLDVHQVDELETILGKSLCRQFNPQLVDVGARWIVAQLDSAEAVLTVRPDFQRMKKQDVAAKATGVVVFGEHDRNHTARIEVRAFAPAQGVNEDPVCGSGTGSVGAFINQTGQVNHFGTEFLASQGAAVGRAGLLYLNLGSANVHVGGMAVTCIDGQLIV